MSATVDERICHVYRNRDGDMGYPTTDTPVKYMEPSDVDGEDMVEVDICGKPLEVFYLTTADSLIPDTEFWYCPDCDRLPDHRPLASA